MTRPSHDSRLGHFDVGRSPPRGATPASPERRRRGPVRFLVRTVAVLLAVGVVAGGIVALLAAVPTPQSDPAIPISQRQWQLIAKDPDAHRGERIVVYGEVTQLDAATGQGAMRASVHGEPEAENSGTNTYVVADRAVLSGLVEGDTFRADATVVGAQSYDTQIGGTTTAPELEVTALRLRPSS